MNATIELLLLAAAKARAETGENDWEAVIEASGVSPAFAERLVSAPEFNRLIDVNYRDTQTGLVTWRMTAKGEELASLLLQRDRFPKPIQRLPSKRKTQS